MKHVKDIIGLMTVALILSTQVAVAQLVCQRAPAPIEITGAINADDTTQVGRITRDGSASSCEGSANINLEDDAVRRREVHNFKNPYNETVCVRVEQDFSGCAGIQTQSAAYSGYNSLFPAANVIGDSGFSTINTGSYSFGVGPNVSFTVVVHEVNPNTGCPLYKLKISYLRNCRQAGFDNTNDGKADPTVYRPATIAQWYSMDSDSQQLITRNFGTVGDIATGGSDYTGDGQSDVSLFRPNTGTWYHGIDPVSPESNFKAVQFGTAGDRPAQGDYDGDGLNDIAQWRSSDGNFYILRSSDSSLQVFHWGDSFDRLISGDFDGDTLNDFVVVRPTSDGLIWYIQKSNYNYGFNEIVQWGLAAGDVLTPADYDGDTITDIAVWRQSTGHFYVRRSSDLSVQVFKWGMSGDKPQPADYDGDGRADFAVFRPSNGAWYILNSQTDTIRILTLGQIGDQAMAAPYRVQ